MHAQAKLAGAIITAGGQARRFGADKVQARLGGQTLLERAAQSLPPAPTRLIVSSNLQHTLTGWRTVPDDRPGGLGPLCGLETGLRLLPQAGWVAFCAADMPHLTPQYWQWLMTRATPQVGAVVVRDPTGRLQPLAALYQSSVLPLVTQSLDTGQLSMNALLLRLEVCVLDGPQGMLGVLDNINTPADLERAACLPGQEL